MATVKGVVGVTGRDYIEVFRDSPKEVIDEVAEAVVPMNEESGNRRHSARPPPM